MLLGGFQKCTLIDYPGKLAAIVFTQGCPWRCPFCHNAVLHSFKMPEKGACYSELEVLDFLKTRKGKLDGIVISGGEPTAQADLIPFLRAIHALGFLIKIDTNGVHPEVMQTILREGLVDFWAMDIKGPLERYQAFTGVSVDLEAIRQAIRLILKSGVDHEFRTTVIRSLHTLDDLKAMAPLVTGAQRFTLQRFVPSKAFAPSLRTEVPYTEAELRVLEPYFRPLVRLFSVR